MPFLGEKSVRQGRRGRAKIHDLGTLNSKILFGSPMPEQAPKSRDDLFIRRVHFPAGLKFQARHLPGGIKTMIYLAWLSKDEKVRNVAVLWNRLKWRAGHFDASTRASQHHQEHPKALGDSPRHSSPACS